MPTSETDPHATLRRSVYAILIAISCATMLARIALVESKTAGPDGRRTPFLSANDRSRWCTVRALVDEGTYAIDTMVAGRDANWKTIDMVRHRGPDRKHHYYSSKPPLFPTLLAAEYWLIKRLTGESIADNPFYVGRLMLALTNVLPMLLYFFVLVRFLEWKGTTNFGRVYIIAAAAFGTFLTTFSVTVNNHLPAAISVLLATSAAMRIWYCGDRSYLTFVAAGLCAAFAAANELPALSFLTLLGMGLLVKAPRQALLAFTPAVVVVAAGFFGTNYIAHGTWRPAYAHRHDGPVLFSSNTSIQTLRTAETMPPEIRTSFMDIGKQLSNTAEVRQRPSGKGWALVDSEKEVRYAIVETEQGIEFRTWDNWYEYDGSYWLPTGRQGVDRGERSRATYTFHVLVGHHGIFSLTPMWLVTLAGLVVATSRPALRMRLLAAITIALSIICLVFYIYLRPEQDRNYGGVCSGFRWFFWFTPLWLMAMIPAADRMASHRGWRVVGILLLLASVFSVTFPATNPWTHPWIFQYWENIGWISYALN